MGVRATLTNAQATGKATLRSNIVANVKFNFCDYNFLLAISLQNSTTMNEMK